MATILPVMPLAASEVRPVETNTDSFEIPPFDPAIHLAFEEPSARHSFTELGLSKPKNAPDMCFTEPFQLFSEEGVRMIRRDLLRKEVLDKHMTTWARAPCAIGDHEETATWINSIWQHPATIDCISKAFGLPVRLLGRKGEVGYVNVQLGPEGHAGVYKLGEVPSEPLKGSTVVTSQYDEILTDAWHRDSTQIVCVLMLSDTSTMVGGETAIRTGDGTILKARGAKMGGAVVMQGAHTVHAALRATNATERISMVTSYMFADPILDDSGTSMRSIDLTDPSAVSIQNHFLLHKLSRLRERIDIALEQVKVGQAAGESPTKEAMQPWVQEQMTFLKQMSWELFERYPNFLYKDIPQDAICNYLADI